MTSLPLNSNRIVQFVQWQSKASREDGQSWTQNRKHHQGDRCHHYHRNVIIRRRLQSKRQKHRVHSSRCWDNINRKNCDRKSHRWISVHRKPHRGWWSHRTHERHYQHRQRRGHQRNRPDNCDRIVNSLICAIDRSHEIASKHNNNRCESFDCDWTIWHIIIKR